jgi:hypothetical protein
LPSGFLKSLVSCLACVSCETSAKFFSSSIILSS